AIVAPSSPKIAAGQDVDERHGWHDQEDGPGDLLAAGQVTPASEVDPRESSQTPDDPDDWFAEPEPTPTRQAGRVPAQVDPDAQTHELAPTPVDDWLAPEPLTRKLRSPRAASIANRRILMAVAIALALLLVGLGLGGVFSGSGKRRANTPPTRQTT